MVLKLTALMISNNRSWKMIPGILGLTLGLLVLIAPTNARAAELTALDKYVAKPDTNYQFRLLNTVPSDGYTAYTLEMIDYSKITDKEERKNLVTLLETKGLNKEKSFLGFEVKNLYDFFLIFVFMAGIASVILFFVSRKLVRMMNGIR